MMSLTRCSITLIMLLFSTQIFAQLSTTELSNKSKGIELFNQFKTVSAIPFLSIAAKAGDSEAQYYLAESIRKNNRYMTQEAQSWYEASAEQGDLYAMIQLGRSNADICTAMQNCPQIKKQPIEWLNQAQTIARQRAEQGNAEAMYIMYEVSTEDGWLEKSANAGYSIAQYWMGIRERQGEGSFIMPWKRSESIEKWFKASSEGGNPKAMMAYLEILYKNGDMNAVRHWIEEAAKTGDQDAISSYGAYLSHTPDKIGLPLDLVKGYGLLLLLKELDGGGNVQAYLEDKLPEVSQKMTPQQITDAKLFATQWKGTHPPLSFFPEKLSR